MLAADSTSQNKQVALSKVADYILSSDELNYRSPITNPLLFLWHRHRRSFISLSGRPLLLHHPSERVISRHTPSMLVCMEG
jgi:hypothetical protein